MGLKWSGMKSGLWTPLSNFYEQETNWESYSAANMGHFLWEKKNVSERRPKNNILKWTGEPFPGRTVT